MRKLLLICMLCCISLWTISTQPIFAKQTIQLITMGGAISGIQSNA